MALNHVLFINKPGYLLFMNANNGNVDFYHARETALLYL